MENEEKIAVMTGATSGFGKVIAQHLIEANYNLIFLARSESKATKLIQDVKNKASKQVDFILCDLSSLDSISKACDELNKRCAHIDLLILNAGIWNHKLQDSKDGIEETLQVNLLAPALMVQRLKDKIPANKQSKVLITASTLHQGDIQYADLEFKKKFSGINAYRQSKLGVILLTRLWAKMPEFSDVSFYSIHPGVVATQIGDRAGWFSRMFFKIVGSSLEKGAKTHIHLIDTATEDLKSGGYYAKCEIGKASKKTYDIEEASTLLKAVNDYLKDYL